MWRHLNFFQYKAFIHADAPRVSCPRHGVGAGPQLRTSDHDGISAQVTVVIKAVAEPEDPEGPGKPGDPEKPEKPEKPEMPHSGSAVQALSIISLLLVIASAICVYATAHLRSSRIHN